MEFSRDPYDQRVAFDDIHGPDGGRDLVHASAAILHRLHRRRLPAPMRVVGVDYDPTHVAFDAPRVIVGDEEMPPTGLPVYDGLRERFAAALPAPKFVRVDTPETYAAFREARRDPYVAELERRLSDLEVAFADHVEHHNDVLGEDIYVACGEAQHGGQPVALPLPEWTRNRVACWRDGGELLCTVAVPTPHGPRLATSGTHLAGYLDEVIDAASAEDLDPEDIVLVGGPLAQVVAGTSLVSEILRAAPELAERSPADGGLGVMSAASDPSLAAAMALIQRCQQGDRRACADAITLGRTRPALVAEAQERLAQAQEQKLRRVS